MTEKKFEIVKNLRLTADIFKMTLRAEGLPEMKAGQFLNLELPNRQDLLLKRPFGINDWDYKNSTVDIVYRVRGKGTVYMSGLIAGECVNVILPLGNGFKLEKAQKKVIILAGGLGVAPLLPLKKLCESGHEFYTFLGFKNKADGILLDEFKAFSRETIVNYDDTDRAFITDKLEQNISRIKPDVILACGPTAMFNALKRVDTGGVPTFVSLEERMACGVGACLVCACDIIEGGGVHKKRCCKDGPVFRLEEVVL